MFYLRSQHSFEDGELISGKELAELLGVSCPAITKARNSGRIDTFENSRHKECYHKVLSVQQFTAKKDRSKVTTPTTAQKKAGYDNLQAQATAHKVGGELPDNLRRAPVPNRAPVETIDFGADMQERQELEVSRAEKEYHNARLAKLKADEKEGSLVDKELCFTRAYQIGAQVQEKVMNLYVQLAPKICGGVQELLIANGVEAATLRVAMKDAQHTIGEMIRKECVSAMQFLSSKTAEDFLD